MYLAVQSSVVLAAGYHPRHSPAGIGGTALIAVVMFALAAGKARVWIQGVGCASAIAHFSS